MKKIIPIAFIICAIIAAIILKMSLRTMDEGEGTVISDLSDVHTTSSAQTLPDTQPASSAAVISTVPDPISDPPLEPAPLIYGDERFDEYIPLLEGRRVAISPIRRA